MKTRFARFAERSRLYYLALLSFLFLITNFITRIVLQTAFPDMIPFSGEMFPGLLKGLINDVGTLFFVLLLPAILLLLPKDSFMKKRVGTIYTAVIFLIFSLTFIFNAFAEFFFWDEFGSRFNFIAVDYLIYTTELVQNIVESYPLFWLLAAVFILSIAATYLMLNILRRIPKYKAPYTEYPQDKKTFGKRLTLLGSLYLAAFLMFTFFSPLLGSQSRFWNEYAKNGVYELFSAYLNNQLDYRAFYKTMQPSQAFSLMQAEVRDASPALEPSSGHNLIRMVDSQPPETRPNVIIVIMESMGSKWLGEYTPNLQSLAASGLSFSNMMSTGTRTVRGLEAVMLSIPPTPGNSIVRRPDNDNLFNLGTVFRQNDYDLSFIYGGVGFFDNMNAFFEVNHYSVTDKLDFDAANKTFSNAWGQCDEDLYAQSLTQADKSHAAGKLFQQVLLTTSNHRPFTYPEGKVSLEPGSGRRGAIQYSDYAIGEFMRQARTKPWFDNTVFVFVGDHPSSIAGRTEVPADAYGIVCIMYGPKFFQPETIDTLCSQIDVAPTLLTGLGWGYRSQFFGTDVRTLPKEDGRAWISTYQLLGYRTNDRLVVLKPGEQVEVSAINPLFPELAPGGAGRPSDELLVGKAIASYQCAYDLFVSRNLKETSLLAYMPKIRRAEPDKKREQRTPENMESGNSKAARHKSSHEPSANVLATYLFFSTLKANH